MKGKLPFPPMVSEEASVLCGDASDGAPWVLETMLAGMLRGFVCTMQPRGWFSTDILNGCVNSWFSVHARCSGTWDSTWRQALTFVSAVFYTVPKTEGTP